MFWLFVIYFASMMAHLTGPVTNYPLLKIPGKFPFYLGKTKLYDDITKSKKKLSII